VFIVAMRDSISPHMSKIYSDPTAALAGLLHDNMTVAAGG